METSTVDWSNLPDEHNLSRFAAELPGILEKTGYDEMYGVQLQAPEGGQLASHTTLIILQKFLRANAGDLSKAELQLTSTLNWRKSYRPLDALNETFASDKFGGLGYVTKIKGAKETQNEEDVATFNIYGVAAKQPQKTFGDTDAFIRWRVAVMELTLQQLHLDKADLPIPDYGQGPDPYQAIQIHDYMSVSFFRQPAEIKASSKKIIETFQAYYPETVSYKYFVNVPTIMQWMMGAMKMVISRETFQKMTWMTYGNTLNQYLGDDIPKEYGGKGPSLEQNGLTVKYDGEDKAPLAESVADTRLTPAVADAVEKGKETDEARKESVPPPSNPGDDPNAGIGGGAGGVSSSAAVNTTEEANVTAAKAEAEAVKH